MTKGNPDWEIDEDKKYVWRHKVEPYEIMRFASVDDKDLQCLYVRFLFGEDWLSNYFLFNRKDYENMDHFAFATDMIDRYRKEKFEEEMK